MSIFQNFRCFQNWTGLSLRHLGMKTFIARLDWSKPCWLDILTITSVLGWWVIVSCVHEIQFSNLLTFYSGYMATLSELGGPENIGRSDSHAISVLLLRHSSHDYPFTSPSYMPGKSLHFSTSLWFNISW